MIPSWSAAMNTVTPKRTACSSISRNFFNVISTPARSMICPAAVRTIRITRRPTNTITAVQKILVPYLMAVVVRKSSVYSFMSVSLLFFGHFHALYFSVYPLFLFPVWLSRAVFMICPTFSEITSSGLAGIFTDGCFAGRFFPPVSSFPSQVLPHTGYRRIPPRTSEPG